MKNFFIVDRSYKAAYIIFLYLANYKSAMADQL